ncbi:MAG TPA: ABC transporter substrate-binding protein [Stellaceae bacterium]|nr:ABC transporter substrate-binding protein [Stellaceae bacterium]
MRLFGRTGLVACALLASAMTGPAHAASDANGAISDLYATLTQTMHRGAQLGDKGRYEALAPAIHRDFDLTRMAQLAIGPGWANLSPAERQQVTDAFTRYTIATYASEFSKDSGVKFEIAGTHAMPYGTVVDTQLVQADGDKTAINYLMRQNGDRWQIADIYLQGTISQIANLRSQFSAVVLHGGAQALVDTLNRKTASLIPETAAS